MTTITIVIAPAGPDRYVVRLNGRELCRSRTPLLAAARLLQGEGVVDSTTIVMLRDGETGTGVRSTIGRAANLTVLENERAGPVYAPYRPAPVKLPRQLHGVSPISAVRVSASRSGAPA